MNAYGIWQFFQTNKNLLTSVTNVYTIVFRGNVMVKQLIQHGNSAALVIDKPILEMLHISFETAFELSTDGKNIILSPQSVPSQENDVLASLEKINKKYANVLAKLGE
jgi:antitoxin component of MazEF toxin-antitoxin module